MMQVMDWMIYKVWSIKKLQSIKQNTQYQVLTVQTQDLMC